VRNSNPVDGNVYYNCDWPTQTSETMHTLIDIGANLTHDSFDADRDAIIENAAAVGVTRQIVTGADVDGSKQALALANQYPGQLWATAGVHPHHAKDYDAAADAILRELAAGEPVVAVGEMGLDYFRNFSSHEEQEFAFDSQLQIAVDVQKPVFLHQRDGHGAFVAVLKNHLDNIPGGVAHCFTGTKDEMKTYLDMGLYVGITGWICDERRGHDLQEAVKYLPKDRVMLETDAPYLLPRDLSKEQKKAINGRRNEPALLPHVLAATASLMGLSEEELAEAATSNSETLFGLPSR